MQAIIEKIKSHIKKDKKVINNSLFKNYLEQFYSDSNFLDINDYSKDLLFQLCLSGFKFFENKKKDELKIRIENFTSKDIDNLLILDVVGNDTPFLVDSLVIYFNKIDIEVKNIIHPIFYTKRSKDNVLQELTNSSQDENESVIQFHLSHIASSDEIRAIESDLRNILSGVHLVFKDWKNILLKVTESRSQLDKIKDQNHSLLEYKEFIDWICNHNFILLGSCELDLVKKDNEYTLKENKGSRLGIFKSEDSNIRPSLIDYSSMDVRDIVKNPYLVEILKSRYKSQIHRNVNAERIRVQKFNDKGEVIGEYRFIGLFTSSVYYQDINLIPIIREKINKVIKAANFKPLGHSYKDLVSVLESYPRDELFQIEDKDLLRISLGIVAMSGRPLVRLFARNDKFNRFVSFLIFIPRDRFNTYVKEEIYNLLASVYGGEILGSYIQITESNLARINIVVSSVNNTTKSDISKIEKKLFEISSFWVDDFTHKVNQDFSVSQAKKVINDYKNAFSASYTNRFDVASALKDIEFINRLYSSDNDLKFRLYQTDKLAKQNISEIKIYSTHQKLHLSDMMPVLESFGFNIIHEHTYNISPKSGVNVWVYYFTLNLSKTKEDLTQDIVVNFEDTINKIYQSKTKAGFLNRMVVAANLNSKQISLLRAYSKYLYQAKFRYSQKYISDTLVKYRDFTKLIIELFEEKFNPAKNVKRENNINKISVKIDKILEKVTDSGDDVVLNRFLNIINSTTRTNFFQKDKNGLDKDYISFKFDCSKIQDLVLPVPYAEIFVFSSNVEGIHLRGGKVARGGLRWSDRHEDFRTEVLGLMKAQMTKNAVIVPVGSKGGFVVKKDISSMSREDSISVAIDCYKTFLRGMLDITDNIVDGQIITPKNVFKYDDKDPYLVVAADKGTATFSDIANSIAAEYNFWLGDAFASGGSVGYDHKKMGITAKGAWISVKRHFSEMGLDTQSQDFTCAGIGDLSGDVFGNGMLLSKHIKLVAAFNHMHIFLDPNPDSSISFKERQRIFNLPRSSWLDYNKNLISKGGGVFDRSARLVKISKEAGVVLDIEELELSPDKLLIAILKSPVDLLWNGGIGTYVKSGTENHLDVGDKVNDGIRIDGADLRCKVVGEGGNLGLTQRGRIEYALNGGKINTDSIDNAAGVDCSDHEVNIKIALVQAMKSGKISLTERNKILESMTSEVEKMVLDDNLLQTQAITMSQSKGVSMIGDHARFLSRLEKIGLLNRQVESLPNAKQIEKRQSDRIGMTRPELSVMLSYAKMDLYNNIINSKLIKDSYFEDILIKYFPKRLQKDFKEEVLSHQLKYEIITTEITNLVIGRVGISFVSQIARDNGFEISNIVRNIIIVFESFNLNDLYEDIEALDNKTVPVEIKMRMLSSVNKLLERSLLWLLRNSKTNNIAKTSKEYKDNVKEISGNLVDLLAEDSRNSYNKNIEAYKECKIHPDLARKISSMDALASAYDIIHVSKANKIDIKTSSRIYFKIGTRLHLKWIRTKILGSLSDNYWQRISSKTVTEDLYNYQMKITNTVAYYNCKNNNSCNTEKALDNWIESEDFLIKRYDRFIDDFKSQVKPDISMFIVALNRIKALIS